ncbi:MAG: hypothetical protein HRU03_05845 [Nanoarchaeales archaeon]|nr:hypothetical protein [Nanoarchaeales archaeon]
MTLESIIFTPKEEKILRKHRDTDNFIEKCIQTIYKSANIYNTTIDKTKKAVLSFPQFTGLNHQRVLRQKTRLSKLIDINKAETITHILNKPGIAGCSYKRDLAIFDIVRTLEDEGLEVTQKQVLNNFTKSPYVPNTKKLRITKAKRLNQLEEMPPMYHALKKTSQINKLKNI